MVTKDRLTRLARLGENTVAPSGNLSAKAAREIRRCAKLGMRDTMVSHLYATRAERLAGLLADGPQGRAGFEESEQATRALIKELA